MHSSQPQHRGRLCGVAGLLALALSVWTLGPGAPMAPATVGPEIAAVWSSEVVATSARLRAEINPAGLPTTYRFEYIAQAAYEANLAAGHEGFAGALAAPASGGVSIGEGTATVSVFQSVSGLSPETAYRYRVQATSGAGTETGTPYALRTQGLGSGQLLADGRGWEMVSPIEKNGGQVQAPGEIDGGGVLQVSPDGEAATYSSSASFGAGALGAPLASQYISRRTPGGWLTENVTTPVVSGSYGEYPNGVPYQLFSEDLALGIVVNGQHCREQESTGCPVANRSLRGTEAPPGYQDYYLRNDETGAFSALVTQANSPSLAESPDWFDLALAGASPDLRHVILSTCAKLTSAASETPGPEGCDPAKPNLYEYAEGQLKLLNTSPGAMLAAQGGAISADGQRVYFAEAGKLWLREGVSAPYELAEGGEFQAASANGVLAFYTTAGHLYRYDAGTHSATDLTPAGSVKGVLGASEDGSTVYFQDAAGLEQWREGATTQIASGAEAAQESDWPPATGSARVSADGQHLLFLSKALLSGNDNTPAEPADCGGVIAGVFQSEPCQEVFLYDAGSHALACLSCNPTGERPEGPSTIPGAIANGKEAAGAPGEIVTDAYKPRALSANGRRLFFDSRDALLLQDTDRAPDVYEWEALGEGSCQRVGGCLSLVSSGRSAGGAVFVDASANGSDAFFLTAGSLVPSDPGSVDLYDAREGGGFPEPPSLIPCQADACQTLPAEPEDPEPGTLRQGLGNPSSPPLLSPPGPIKCAKDRVLEQGRCVLKPRHKQKRPRKRSRRRPAHNHRSAR
ncbi:MAG TPA: hypothetical protein VNY52_10175 [Solirubrobacteraceae bacterium]|nr:hypothetical protein [Solirubrobacteraceae bacterium]